MAELNIAGQQSLQQPASPLDYAQNIAQNDANTQFKNLQAASGATDLQQKQRSMQFSMLSGILNEPDPEKQRMMIGNIIPIANRLNPSFQIDKNIDVPTIRALVQSQVSPTEQATLANQRLLYGVKAMEIKTNPLTGQLVRVNKATGEESPLTSAETLQYQTTGILPPPNDNRSMNDIVKAGNPQGIQPDPQQPAFGFPTSNYANDINSLKLARKNAADFDKNKQQRDMLANQTLAQIEALRPDLSNVHGGSAVNRAELAAGSVFGTGEEPAAKNAASLTQGLALNLSNLQQVGGGGRAMKAALQTLLNSKPDPYGNYNENNISNLNHIESTVNQYKLETSFLEAYKDANPLHVIDNHAYDLFDALSKKFPIESVGKDGKVQFNQQNVQAFEDAIPDALSNPYNYMGKTNAKTQAESNLKSSESLPQPTTTPIDTPEAIGSAYKSGKITKDQAKQLLAKHGIK